MTEIMVVPQNMYLPAMNLQIAIDRRNELVGFVKKIMVDGTDYGKIPGAGDKPTLLKPGAEKLTTFFGLSPSFVLAGSEEDWDGNNHNGEPFFYYRYRCELYRMGNMIAGGEGSCNSHESKYRYRKGERTCPNCEAATIYKSKEPGKGFYCWTKKGGCGATFGEKDARIIGQETGRVLNPDVADQVNTFQKMAQKRALIAATLLAVNASEFFTQDIEDMVDLPSTQFTVVEEVKTAPKPTQPPAVQHRQPRPEGTRRQPDPVVEAVEQALAGPGLSQDAPDDNPFDAEPAKSPAFKRFQAEGSKTFGKQWDDARHWLIERYTKAMTPGNLRKSSNDMFDDELDVITDGLVEKRSYYQKEFAKVAGAAVGK